MVCLFQLSQTHETLPIQQKKYIDYYLCTIFTIPTYQHSFVIRHILNCQLKNEFDALNEYSICGKHELKWEVQKHYADIFSLAAVGMELLWEEYKMKVKKQLHPSARKQINLDA